MSSQRPGTGHDTARPDRGPTFGSLVHNLLGRDKASASSQDRLDSIHPSTKLPSTGLKRNSGRWKEEHPGGHQHKERTPRSRSRASSSSFIPSRATSGEDGRTEAERAEGQEGPTGRGPGGHEEDVPAKSGQQEKEGWFKGIQPNGHAHGHGIHDSPIETVPPHRTGYSYPSEAYQHYPHRTDSFSHDQAPNDQPRPCANGDNDGIPQSQASKDPSVHTRPDEPLQGHSAPEEKQKGTKLSEVFEGRDGERERKLTDEAGRRPGGLAAVKSEEPPGPRNTIVLDPRISHMNYHHVFEHTPAGLVLGPILKVSADGETEHAPGQTPQPSRHTSFAHKTRQSSSGSEAEVEDNREHRTEKSMKAYEKNIGKGTENGTWMSALDPEASDDEAGKGLGRRPIKKGSAGSASMKRWSSFRDERDKAERGIHPTEEESDGDGEEHRRNMAELHDRQHNGPNGITPSERESILPTADAPSAETDSTKRQAQKGWSMLRSRVVPSRTATSGTGPTPSGNKTTALAPTVIASLPVTTELMAGQLQVMILKTWLDRDEDGNRAVPVLIGNLRFRVGDSVGLKEGERTGKEMFKLECEYGNGAVKWVIYRELRDFLSLHAHYRAANFGSNVPGINRTSRHVDIPEFPKMSIPYLKGLQGRQGGKDKGMSKAEYAQTGRDALQQYLVALIRAVIFRPESNRLCRFFELSSLTLALAPRGGFQGKAGFLKIPGSNASRRANQPGLTPTSWVNNRSPKWFIVRDSYFVATDGPQDTDIYDVFIIDEDFSIERPKRVFRAGLHFMTGRSSLNLHRRKASVSSTIEQNDADPENPYVRDMLINSGEGQGEKAMQLDTKDGEEADASHHTFFIVNSQRRLKLVARNARQMHQFIVSMERVAAQCIWAGQNRFDSFAPLRVNCSAQWLVDGRDYFWNLSRAINMAKDSIYIHDWWISPEIYLRRPGDERYRLDNLLKRKAEEGVKIHVILYAEVSDNFTPVDSTYTKRTLVGLHPNVMVQRSPSHFQTGTFYWSHHEKMCVIDETIAFMGGLDLCFGRWDTSQHVLTDEDFTEPNGANGPVWHGKDYANERVAEFASLDKPFEMSLDRSKVSRMPWHDVGIQIVGQPARDLCRHFIQRWNLLIRTKNHKRRYPFLLPPPDFTSRELDELKLRGTCEVQICRSVGPWSMGTLEKIEHSIQNAYIKSIELSEHFVYIENQFFITSTIVDGIPVENGIGDAMVDRIIKAYKQKTPWRACIVIPLLPGYTFPIDSSEASSVRLILECQNRTISRGTNSIFSRLRKEGIDPDEYITFFSLRGWAKFKSGVLTTEQVYIHGKTMIVDDRLVIIGSANINERSQRGDRDSELASITRDTDMIEGTMAGKPFKVGRFAHTLRMRLMREHVGVDVDSIEEDQLMSREPVADEEEVETWDPDHEQQVGDEGSERGITKIKRRTAGERFARTVQSGVGGVTKGLSENMIARSSKISSTITRPFANLISGDTIAHQTPETETYGDDSEREDFEGDGTTVGFAGSMVPTLEEKTIFERRPDQKHSNGHTLFDMIEEEGQSSGGEGPNGLTQAEVPEDGVDRDAYVPEDDKEGGRGVPKVQSRMDDGPERFGAPANAQEGDEIAPTKGTDRSAKAASEDEQAAIKARKTLRKHFNAKVGMSAWTMPTPTPVVDPNRFHDPLDEQFWKDMWTAVAVHNTEIYRKVFRCIPDDLVTSWAQYKAFASHGEKFNMAPVDATVPGTAEPPKVTHDGPGTQASGGGGSGGASLGQGGEGDHQAGVNTSQIRESDVVDGKPRDSFYAVGSALLGRQPSAHHHNLSNLNADTADDYASGAIGSAADLTAGGLRIGLGGTKGGPGGTGGAHVPGTGGNGNRSGTAAKQKPPSSPNPSGVSVGSGSGSGGGGEENRKSSGPGEAFQDWEREEMEELLGEIRGHLVVYSTRFLEAEDAAHNFLFNSDKIMPLPIFN